MRDILVDADEGRTPTLAVSMPFVMAQVDVT